MLGIEFARGTNDFFQLPNYLSDDRRVFRPIVGSDSPGSIRGCGGRAGEDLCAAAAEALGDGLRAQGGSTLGQYGGSGTVTVILVLGWHG